jgi:DNA-binding NarL/FixJ family response regulator
VPVRYGPVESGNANWRAVRLTAPFPVDKNMRILVVVPDMLRGEGISSVLRQLEAGAQIRFCDKRNVLSLAEPAGDALRAVVVAHPWISRATLQALHRRQPEAALVVCTGHDDADTHRALLATGVAAIVADDAPPGVIGAAVQLALCGDVSVHARCLRQEFPLSGAQARRSPRSDLNLTSRQFDVLPLIAQVRPNRAIADTLGIGLRTVKGHVAVILRAFNADNRRDAGRHARRWLSRNAAFAPRDAQRSSTGPRHTKTGIR